MSVLSEFTGIHISEEGVSFDWNELRDSLEAIAVEVVNYYVPGSAAITSGLTSKGAQEMLSSPIGQITTLATGAAGAGQGYTSPQASLSKTIQNNIGNIPGSTIIADATAGAIIGGATAAARGENIGQGMLTGAEYAGASSVVKGWDIGGKVEPFVGDRAAQGIQAGLQEFAGQEATGSSLRQSLLEGGTVGLATGLFPAKEGATAGQQAFTAAERELAKQLIGGYLAERYGDTGSTAPSSAPPPGATPSGVTYGQGQQPSPGSAALAQALRVGDAGAPIFGSSEEKNKAPSGWNVESLRYMG